MADRVPAEVFPVYTFVLEEVEARGWTLGELAVRMGGDAAVNALALDILIYAHDERRLHIGDTMSCQLGRAFGVSPQLFKNLDDAYRAVRDNRPGPGNA